jgi:hypothetical protein
VSFGADAIVGHEAGSVGIGGGDAGGGYGFTGLLAAGNVQVEREQLGQQVFLRRKPVGGQDSGVQGRLGVLQRMVARICPIRADGYEASERLDDYSTSAIPFFSIRRQQRTQIHAG